MSSRSKLEAQSKNYILQKFHTLYHTYGKLESELYKLYRNGKIPLEMWIQHTLIGKSHALWLLNHLKESKRLKASLHEFNYHYRCFEEDIRAIIHKLQYEAEKDLISPFQQEKHL